MDDQKFVTVICTTPWGERHEFRAPFRIGDVGTISLELPTGEILWQFGVERSNPYRIHNGYRYELGPNWRQEIGHE